MFDKLFEFLFSILHLFKFWTICPTEHAGFVRRFGVHVRDLHPGWNWVVPFWVETTVQLDTRLWADVLPAQSLRTTDGVLFVVRMMVTHHVVSARAAWYGSFDGTNTVHDLAAGALGAAFLKSSAEDVYSGRVLRKVRSAVAHATKTLGIEVIRLQFADCAPAPAYRLFGAVKDEN